MGGNCIICKIYQMLPSFLDSSIKVHSPQIELSLAFAAVQFVAAADLNSLFNYHHQSSLFKREGDNHLTRRACCSLAPLFIK